MTALTLKPIEQVALTWLAREGGALLVTLIPERTETDVVFGTRTPGEATFKRLEKLGLCLTTEEDEITDEDGASMGLGTWTPMMTLTEAGEAWLAAHPDARHAS